MVIDLPPVVSCGTSLLSPCTHFPPCCPSCLSFLPWVCLCFRRRLGCSHGRGRRQRRGCRRPETRCPARAASAWRLNGPWQASPEHSGAGTGAGKPPSIARVIEIDVVIGVLRRELIRCGEEHIVARRIGAYRGLHRGRCSHRGRRRSDTRCHRDTHRRCSRRRADEVVLHCSPTSLLFNASGVKPAVLLKEHVGPVGRHRQAHSSISRGRSRVPRLVLNAIGVPIPSSCR